MGTISNEEHTITALQLNYSRENEIKAFDETKMGVKGLVDSGLKTIPTMFIRPVDELSEELNTPCVKLQVPVISFEGITEKKERYDEVVKQVMDASEKWGFFQVVDHGIPVDVLEKMLEGIRMFHEQDTETKKAFYTRGVEKPVVYGSNYDLYVSKSANWRDTLSILNSSPGFLDPNDVPEICRDVMMDYINNALKLGDTLLELLSVALGLKPDYLKEDMECDQGWSIVNHYYPACPTPELTIGTSKHSDPSFFTILLQDQIGGLQVLHDNQWVDVKPIPGAFVVNIGDLLQILSNDRFKSVYHRVTANVVGPRISAAFFFKGNQSSTKVYGPIKELVTEDHPAVYKEFTLGGYQTEFFSRPLTVPMVEEYKVPEHVSDK